MTAVDFFSGCGGSSLGMKSAGIKVILAIDNDSAAARTYRYNFPDVAFIESNILDLSELELEPYLWRRTRPLLFSACAPCQPFSRQRRQTEYWHKDALLLWENLRFIEKYEPEFLFLENVPGLRGHETASFDAFESALLSMGYYLNVRYVRAQDYGVPQRRRRLVALASRLGPIEFPEPTHGPGRARFSTVRDWISWLPPIAAGQSDPSVENHKAAGLSPLNLERIRSIPEGGTRLDWPDHLKLSCHRLLRGFTDVYGRMRWDGPAPALTTRCISLSNGRFGHPDQDRAISAREAACLQTFPVAFQFQGNQAEIARQIGNAVPPLLAKQFGEVFMKHSLAHFQGSEHDNV